MCVKIMSTQGPHTAFNCVLDVMYHLFPLHFVKDALSRLFGYRADQACDLLLTGHSISPSGPTCHLTTWSNPPDCSFYHGSADCWYLQLMSTLSGGPYIDVCGESQSCFSRGKFRGIAQSGLSQPQYCLEGEGGWGRRSVAPYTTQLEKDTLWRDWLHFKYQGGHFQ